MIYECYPVSAVIDLPLDKISRCNTLVDLTTVAFCTGKLPGRVQHILVKRPQQRKSKHARIDI